MCLEFGHKGEVQATTDINVGGSNLTSDGHIIITVDDQKTAKTIRAKFATHDNQTKDWTLDLSGVEFEDAE